VVLTLPIREVVPATPRARIVRIDLGRGAFPFRAGQAVLVGAHGFPRRRAYSIACAPEDADRDHSIELLVGVDASGQPGHDLALAPGIELDVEGPVGAFTFPDAPEERRFVFIAGGTGIAPLRAMLRHALAIPGSEVGLFYSVRTPDEFVYQGEFRALAADGLIALRQTITRGTELDWDGARGRVDRVMLSELVQDPGTLCFVCGPPALVSEMRVLLGDLGIVRERIRMEEWS